MPEDNAFAQETINQITPANMRRFGYWLLTVAVIVTACMTSILINQAQYQKDQITLQGTVMEISASVSMILQDNIRQEELIKKNTEIGDLRHED